MKIRYIILPALLAASILCACGRMKESTEEERHLPETSGIESSALPAGSDLPESSAVPETASSGEEGEQPEEDPWAESYYYDEALSAAVREVFTVDNTNNTDEEDPFCSMTEDFLEELDRRAALWLYEGVSDRETEQAMRALSFRFPGDKPEITRGMQSVRAGVYSLKGRDAESLAARIRLGNPEACFYLFLRAYYNAAEDRTRIYMINGLVW